MQRVWFILLPVALFFWVLIEGEFGEAVFVGLISFVFGACAFLMAVRMNWPAGNLIAAIVAVVGLFLSAEAYFEIRRVANMPSPVEVEPCPLGGCMTVMIEQEPEPATEDYQ